MSKHKKAQELLNLSLLALLVVSPLANAGTAGNGNGNGSSGNTVSGSNGNANGNSSSGSTVGGSNGNSSGSASSGNSGVGPQPTNPSTSGPGSTTNGNANGNPHTGNNGNPNNSGNNGNPNNGNTAAGSNGNANGGSTSGGTVGGSSGNSNGSSGNGNGGVGPQPTNPSTSGPGSTTNGNANGNPHTGNNGNPNNSGNNGNPNNGNTAAGSNGNANGGSTNGSTVGGSNGNANGNPHTGDNGNPNNSGNNGNPNNGNSGGHNGNSSGSSTGGSSTGGSETGGSATGGSTAGGSTAGGSTTGGSETGGSDTGGSETGGSESGGSSSGGVSQEDSKSQIKGRILPLVFGSYDIQKKAVNLAEYNKKDLAAPAISYPVVLDIYQNGLQVNHMKTWDVGLGVAGLAYVQNANGLASLATGVVGLAVTKRHTVSYERIVDNAQTADHLNHLPIPFDHKNLDLYRVGESVLYENMGGILFTAAVGVAPVYVGSSVVAEGGFKTYIVKTKANGVMVQLVRAKIRSASVFTGAYLLKIDATNIKQLNEGFTFEFDMSKNDKSVIEAYEAMLTGNLTLAQSLSEKNSSVRKIQSFNNSESIKKRGMTIGVPMVAIINWSNGKLYGETASVQYQDKTKTDLNYGVYFKEEKGRFFHKHKSFIRSFYAAKAVTKNEKDKVVAQEEKATFLWSFETDAGNGRKLKRMMNLLDRELSIKREFNPTAENKDKLKFLRLEAKIDFPKSFTDKLTEISKTAKGMNSIISLAESRISDYLKDGDADYQCRSVPDEDESEEEISNDCKNQLLGESKEALTKISKIANSLPSITNAEVYTKTYALLGKEMMKNKFVMHSLFALDKTCELMIDVKLEGRRISRMMKKIPANYNCRR